MEEEKKPTTAQISVVRFSSYEQPVFLQNTNENKPWILFGKKNDYPNYLIKLFSRSGNHNAIVSGKVDYIVGKGWEGTTERAKQFILKPNDRENLNELTSKVALDVEIFGGCYLQVIRKKGGKGYAFEHVPFHRMRTNKDMSEFYYTKEWQTKLWNPEKAPDWKVFKPFDPNSTQAEGIYYYQAYTPKDAEIDVYPLPEYQAGIDAIETDYEISNFDLNNIKQSFWGNFLVKLKGQPTPEEKAKVEKDLKAKFTSTDKAGGVVIVWSDGDGDDTVLEPLRPGQTVDLFENLNKRVQEAIFTVHKVTSPMLFGIKTEGQLGGRSEILEAYEIFKNTYIQNRQKLQEDIFNFLLTGDRMQRELKLLEKPPIMPEISMQELSAIAPNAGITPQELRAILDKKYNLGLPKAVTPANPAPAAPEVQKLANEKDKRLIKLFSELGQPADKYEIHKVRRIFFSEEEENTFKTLCFAKPLTGKLLDIELGVLKILSKNPHTGYDAIAKQLGISSERVKATISDLTDAGFIEKSGKSISITPVGDEVLPPVADETTSIEVKYRYGLNPKYPGPVIIPTSREFCRELINMNKVYSRKEIEQIANQEDYNVFLYKGGWYHTPDGENSPSCRHIWESLVVTEKR